MPIPWDTVGLLLFVIGGGLMAWYMIDRQRKQSYYYGTPQLTKRPKHKELGKVK
jgi:hypothetical protein